MTIHSAPGARAALAATLCLTVVAPPGMASAQTTGLAPLHGSRSLNAGFLPDPHSAAVRGGGSIDVDDTRLPDECRGYITEAATYEVKYVAGSSPLIFRTASDDDTSLIINGPDAKWTCDDDSGRDLNAEIVFETPTTGTYDVWVGKLSEGTTAATLSVSEVRSSSDEDEDWEEDIWGDDDDSPPEPTNINIKVCNESGRNAQVAAAYKPVGSSDFVMEGWYVVNNGTCAHVATTLNSNFYLYAETQDGSGLSWSGDFGQCVQYPGPFANPYPSGGQCAQGQIQRLFVRRHAPDFGEHVWTLGR